MALPEDFESKGNWLFRYSSFLPLSILSIGLLVHFFTIRDSGSTFYTILPYRTAYEYVCLAISLTGLFVRVCTVGYTPVGTSGRNTRKQVADSLNTTGIYSLVRHPLYLGNFLMWLGVSLLTCHAGFILLFVLAYWLYYERIMFAEEQFLRRKFGKRYLTWANRTPAIIPDFKSFTPPRLPFSWKKVIKKEKNGIFALFLTFSLFDHLAAWLHPETHPDTVLTALTVISGIAYLVLKFIKKRTSLLDEQGR